MGTATATDGTARACPRDLGLRASRLRWRHPGAAERRHAQTRWRRGRGRVPPRRARRRRVDGRPRCVGRALAVRHDGHELLDDERRHRHHRAPTRRPRPDRLRRAGRDVLAGVRRRRQRAHHGPPPPQPLRRAAPPARRDRRRLRDARLGSRVRPARRRDASLHAGHAATATTASPTASSSAR